MWLRAASRIACQRILRSTHRAVAPLRAVLELICCRPKTVFRIAIWYSAAGGTKQAVCVNRNLLCGECNALRSASFRQLECLATEAALMHGHPALKIGQCKC